jgi:hypothetical protein
VSLPSSYRSRRGHIHLPRVLPLVGCRSKTPTVRQCGTRCGARFLERRGAGQSVQHGTVTEVWRRAPKGAARRGGKAAHLDRWRSGAARWRNAAAQARANKQASVCTTTALCMGALGLADHARVQDYSLTASRSAGTRVQSEPATWRPARLRWRSGGAGKHLQEETQHEGRTGNDAKALM